MKTAERILLTSLELFNHQGEANVSCVDIAVELDISPGNLYYHYKGKEVIVSALFDMYQERISKILVSPTESELTVEEFFYFMLMLLESIHLFRFLYHNPADTIAKFPGIAKGFKRVLQAKESCFQIMLQRYADQGAMNLTNKQIEQLVQMMSMMLTQAQNYTLLKGEDIDSEHYIFQLLSHVLFLFTPYLNVEEGVLQRLNQDIQNESL